MKTYRKSDLTTDTGRQQVLSEISGKEWDVTVKINLQNGKSGFAAHPSFPENIYFKFSDIEITKDRAISLGDVLRVKLMVQFHKVKDEWSVAVESGTLPEGKQCSNSARTEERITSNAKSSAGGHQQRHPKGREKKELQKAVIIRIAKEKRLTFAGSFAPLLDNDNELTIYIDEAWMQTAGITSRNVGVIAGVIFRGGPGFVHDLPRIKTHSFENPELARKSLEALSQCKTAMPFILPLRLVDDDAASKHYDILLQQAIRLLCGWLLRPKPERSVTLSIYSEAIAPRHPDTDDATNFYRGLLTADPARYGQFKIKRFIWEKKEFLYIPYADLVAHLSLEHTEFCRQLGNWADYKSLPGYVPFSLELVPRLERLEHLESSANLGDIVDLAIETSGSRFGEMVLDDIGNRLSNRPDLQLCLLQTLEDRYIDKVRDLVALRHAFAAVRRMITVLPVDASPRLRLLWYLLALQDANHNGDPCRITDATKAYIDERDKLRENERELCAFTDLNLAVSFADRWEFNLAQLIVNQCVLDELFPALSSVQRGRMHSALGQYMAMQGDTVAADYEFEQALALINNAPLDAATKAGEVEQTSIYRAFNAFGRHGNSPLAMAEVVLGPLDGNRVNELAIGTEIGSQYRHHLLLRLLFAPTDDDTAPRIKVLRDAYVTAQEHWFTGYPQYPWPLIDMYRALLLVEVEDDALNQAAATYFDRAIETVRMDGHGDTIRLIGAMIATVAACCFVEVEDTDQNQARNTYQNQACNLLDSVGTKLPAASALIDQLRVVLVDPKPGLIPEIIDLYPFNYH